MSLAAVLLLAVIQGLTEFLPVSSDGHLALARILIGGGRSGLVLELVLHAGTLVPLVVLYWGDWWGIAKAPFRRGEEGAKALRLLGLLVLGTIPAAIAGYFLKSRIEALYSSSRMVGVGFLMSATALAIGARASRGAKRDFESVGVKDALVVGLVQSLALLPGLSRSGSTVAAGLVRGLAPASAARLSFLLAVPVIAGACTLEGYDWVRGKDVAEVGGGSLLIGAAVAAIVGTLGLKACVGLLVKN
ncbi:MAG TPA: undecaprenyl-diphosphate phosphatase, partial [Planctomycetota bacterium]|nr:undecaprenyl-diphosphate phosphatase [Planctomycetota bacterium]